MEVKLESVAGGQRVVKIDRTQYTMTAIIDDQPILSAFSGRPLTVLVDSPELVADAARALYEVTRV